MGSDRKVKWFKLFVRFCAELCRIKNCYRLGMGFKGSKVQILSSRPKKTMKRPSYRKSVDGLFLCASSGPTGLLWFMLKARFLLNMPFLQAVYCICSTNPKLFHRSRRSQQVIRSRAVSKLFKGLIYQSEWSKSW